MYFSHVPDPNRERVPHGSLCCCVCRCVCPARMPSMLWNFVWRCKKPTTKAHHHQQHPPASIQHICRASDTKANIPVYDIIKVYGGYAFKWLARRNCFWNILLLELFAVKWLNLSWASGLCRVIRPIWFYWNCFMWHRAFIHFIIKFENMELFLIINALALFLALLNSG